MVRGTWKGTNLNSNKVLKHGKKVWFKNIVIKPDDIGLEVEVYNGNRFVNLLIEEKMVGEVLGSFILTKKIGGNIHKKKKKVKKQKR